MATAIPNPPARKGQKFDPPEQPQPEQPAEPIDTNPPPEPTTSEVSRVPTREELHLMLKYMDRNRLEPLYFAVDDLTKELKVLSDKVKSLEESKK